MRTCLLLLIPLAAYAQVVPPPASAVFDTDTVHEIRLTFQQPNWFELLTSDYAQFPDNTPYREASLVWGENKFEVVGVRFKGNSSYRGATTMKKPFRIKLNEFTKGQKIDGMASFGLSNAWNDPSLVREKPYYEMAAAAGLAAPRSNFAALYINDEYWGLYVLGEIVNGDFLKSHFAKNDDTGNLCAGAVCAGEPGGSDSAVRSRGENAVDGAADVQWATGLRCSKL
jgi:spore coat protein CotH